MTYHKIAALFFIVFQLNACGGSSGDDGANSGISDVNNTNKQLIQILIDEGNNESVETKINYEYDQNGNITFVRSDYRNDGDYDRVDEFTYDDQNNRIKEEVWSNKATTLTSKIIKTYDSNHNVLTLNISDYFNNIFSQQTYTYSGNKIATRTSHSSTSTSVYTYHYTGSVLEIYKDYENDSEIDDIETINYDGNGNIVQEATYDTDGTLGINGIYTYSYDEHDNVLIRAHSKGGVLYQYTYTYDREGNKLTELSQPLGKQATFISYHYN